MTLVSFNLVLFGILGFNSQAVPAYFKLHGTDEIGGNEKRKKGNELFLFYTPGR